jgi:cysteine desulfurase / selenocysteine lyase
MAAALHRLMDAGMESIAAHEADLTRYALRCLNVLPGIRIYGTADPDRVADRLGVITFDVAGMQHGKVAAILGYEGGIGVRDGCFCAHPYVLRLLKISPEEFELFRGRVLHKDRTDLPGMLRMSFGCYNNATDVDRLVEMLTRVIAGDYRGDYVSDPHSGSYAPRGFDPARLDAVLRI